MKTLSNTTAIMISFMRPEYTMECIKSLRERYPSIKIMVGENEKFNKELKDFCVLYNTRYILMPFDSGVCFARNRLVELVETDYILVGDDDFYYTKDAKVDKMIKFLNSHKDFSLIGGRVFEKNRVLDYQGHINIYEDHFHYVPLEPKDDKKDRSSGLLYQKCDITFNFFVARKQDIKDVKWDEKIKVAYEHSDWFICLKKAGGRKVAFTPDAIVVHKPEHVIFSTEQKQEYGQFRNRREDMHYFFAKHKVEYSLGFRGMKTNFDNIKELKNKYYANNMMSFDGKLYNKGDIIHTSKPIEGMRACY